MSGIRILEYDFVDYVFGARSPRFLKIKNKAEKIDKGDTRCWNHGIK